MKKRENFLQKEKVDIIIQENKLSQLFNEVNICVNKKVNDPKLLEKFKNAFRTTQPKNLKGGKLKDYQLEALVWMIELAFKQMNGILADDMGLGKTIQTIAYFAYLKEEYDIVGKHLIVCPLTVCKNWERELKKWMPQAHVEILWGTEQQRQHALKTVVKPRNFQILITPYHALVSTINYLNKIPWQAFIIDQAHKIKNDQAILTQSVRDIDAKFKMLLTGTPLSNNLRQLWSLLNFIMPQLFHDRDLFDKIQDGIKAHQGDDDQKFQVQCRIAKKFHGIIRPFIMRRTKKDTDLGLPPKTQHTLYVSMSKLQIKMYKNYLKYKNVYGRNSNASSTNSQMTTRKICNHPYLFPQIQSPDAQKYGQHLVQNCGKMIVLDKLLKKLINKQKRKILIFSQFKIQMDILQDYCNMRDYNYCRLDGETQLETRQEMMAAFNQDKNYQIPIFMLSTRAGGLGINLVAASVVIIYDVDWNPQNDAQAMDRAYRIGQTKPVNVYKMITQHTIEQRMLQVQKYKLIWDELVIQKGTIMKIRNQDVFSGLNYQKIANMKKGQIFKIQASKDNRAIDQIIKMGAVKDQKKYAQIKQKILKQIQQQKKHNQFNANPFDQKQLIDHEGDNLIKTFNGQLVGKQTLINGGNVFKTQRQQQRIKLNFINNINLPEYYLYEEPETYKQLLWELQREKSKLEELEGEDSGSGGGMSKSMMDKKEKKRLVLNNIRLLQQREAEMTDKAFTNWQREEFKQFIEQQEKQMTNNADNLVKLHELIPNKSIKQIMQYKQTFYNMNMGVQNRRLFNKRKDVLSKQESNKQKLDKQRFHQFLKNNNAAVAKKGAVVENLLSNMRIQNGFESEKQFFESKKYKEDETVKVFRDFQGMLAFQSYEDSVLSSKMLLKKFSKHAKTYGQFLQNPQRYKLVTQDFEQKKSKVLAQAKRRILGMKVQQHRLLQTAQKIDEQF